MKAAIYNPYLDTLGGGERYTMAVATALLKNGYVVDVEWKDSEIRKKLEERFGINLEKVNFVDDIKRGDGYDVCFWVSDGSIPTLKARKNLLHFQVPFKNVSGKSLINRFKLMRINKVVCNSNFTKKIVDVEYGVESVVLYPPVSVELFKAKRKENVILNVARFSNLLQSKNQDVLIKTFKNFHISNSGYKLILVGGVEVGAKEFVEKLEKDIKGYPIEIVKSPDFKSLKDLYAKAKFFWSASGYGVDEISDPQKVEHFGITVVEAMAAKCVPIIFNGGGHKEIIEQGKNGYLWADTGELYRYTKMMVENDKLRKDLSSTANRDAQKYSYEEFENKLITLL